jgi:hypothetical protein
MGSLYILDGAAQSSVEFLLRHGVKVYRLKEDVVLSGTHQKFFNPANARGNWTAAHQTSAYEGHFPVNTSAISGDWQPLDDQEVSKGHYVVSTAQPYGTFAAFMLEPKANDGLCYWNFWDSQLFTTENNASGSFDIRKTYSYLAISSNAMEQVFLSEDSEEPGISPPKSFTEAQILDETGANSAVAVSQSGASLTVKIPAGSGFIDGEAVWFWFNRVAGDSTAARESAAAGTVTLEGAAVRVVNLDADGSATVVFDLTDIDGDGTILPEGNYAIEYLGTDSGASGYTPYSDTHVNPVSNGGDDDKGGKSSSGCYTGFGVVSLLSAVCFFAAGRKPRAKR